MYFGIVTVRFAMRNGNDWQATKNLLSVSSEVLNLFKSKHLKFYSKISVIKLTLTHKKRCHLCEGKTIKIWSAIIKQNNPQCDFVHCNDQKIIFSYWRTARFFCKFLPLLYVELLLWFCTIVHTIYTAVTIVVKDHFNHIDNCSFFNQCWDVFRATYAITVACTNPDFLNWWSFGLARLQRDYSKSINDKAVFVTEDSGYDSPHRPERSNWKQQTKWQNQATQWPVSPAGKYVVCLLPINDWVKKKNNQQKTTNPHTTGWVKNKVSFFLFPLWKHMGCDSFLMSFIYYIHSD